jgi:hypothetical protein
MSDMEIHPRAISVSVQGEELTVRLNDGRTITLPLSSSPRLLNARAEQRQNYRFIGGGEGIHWPDIDEDLSVAGLLAETKRRELTTTATKQLGSFALSQPLEGRVAVQISPSAAGGLSSSRAVLVGRVDVVWHKRHKPVRSGRRFQGGIYTLPTGARPRRQA